MRKRQRRRREVRIRSFFIISAYIYLLKNKININKKCQEKRKKEEEIEGMLGRLLLHCGRFYMPNVERVENAVVNTIVTALWPGTSSVRCEMLPGAKSRFGVPFWFRIYVASCTSGATLCVAIHHNASPSPPNGIFIGRARIYCRYDSPSSFFTHDDTRSSDFASRPFWPRFKVDAMHQYLARARFFTDKFKIADKA